MAYTLLNAVNNTLKRVNEIRGDAGVLTSLTDSTRQHKVDIVIQIWNEALHEVYSLGALSGEMAEGTITLATDTREYSVPSDFEQMSGEKWIERVMVNATNNYRLYEYPGGYPRMYRDQPDPSDYTGQPNFWVYSEVSGKFRMDRTPTSAENGAAYTFLYDKRISLSAASDTFPTGMTDTVVDALLPLVAEVYRLDAEKKPRNPISAQAGFTRALGLMPKVKSRKAYGVRRGYAA